MKGGAYVMNLGLVPYGEAWEAYSLRRLKENPAIAGNVVKGLFGR